MAIAGSTRPAEIEPAVPQRFERANPLSDVLLQAVFLHGLARAKQSERRQPDHAAQVRGLLQGLQ